MQAKEKEAIKKVIEEAYIYGIHGNQDEEKIRNGFHEDFSMLVKIDNHLEKVTVDEWLPRIDQMKKDNPEMWAAETRYTFDLIDETDYAAVAKLDVHKGSVHFSIDYMLLYKFEEGWKIVSKVFSVPA
jgi:hypothetical protein